MLRTVVLASVLSLVAAAQALAGGVEVKGPWIRATPPGAPTAAAYLTIVNHGPTSDRLLGGRTRVAASVTPHQMSMTGGIMRMRALPGGLPVGAGATLALSPNGDHLMLIGVKQALKSGEHVRIVLQFQRAGNVPVDFPVRDDAPGAM